MNNHYKPLLEMNFPSRIVEAQLDARRNANNPLVVALLEKYATRATSGVEPVTCTMVNSFINEASSLANDVPDYDLVRVCESLKRDIASHRIGWQLCSVCEQIAQRNGVYNTLNRRALPQVERLLEMNECDIVAYIKSGALSNVMYVESLRNVCKQVNESNDTTLSKTCLNYTIEMPVTYVDESNIVRINNTNYELTNEGLVETTRALSSNTTRINALLEHGTLTSTSFRYTFGNRTYTVTECGRVTLSFENGDAYNLSLEELRENSNALLRSIPSNEGRRIAGVLDTLARIVENYDNIVCVDTCRVVRTSNDDVYTIVETRDNVRVSCDASRTQRPWAYTCNDIVEALDIMRRSSHIDLNEHYESKINACINERHANEIENERVELHDKSIDEQRKRIDALCERYKNDATKLAILARLANELNEL